jgi:hypothetical protein
LATAPGTVTRGYDGKVLNPINRQPLILPGPASGPDIQPTLRDGTHCSRTAPVTPPRPRPSFNRDRAIHPLRSQGLYVAQLEIYRLFAIVGAAWGGVRYRHCPMLAANPGPNFTAAKPYAHLFPLRFALARINSSARFAFCTNAGSLWVEQRARASSSDAHRQHRRATRQSLGALVFVRCQLNRFPPNFASESRDSRSRNDPTKLPGASCGR